MPRGKSVDAKARRFGPLSLSPFVYYYGPGFLAHFPLSAIPTCVFTPMQAEIRASKARLPLCSHVCVSCFLVCWKGRLVSLKREIRFCLLSGGGVIGRPANEGGLGALAFCFNDSRSLLPLLPVIAF